MSYTRATRADHGIVASAHEIASNCGADILSSGGNVIDAAIATSAVLCVVQNNSCGLGGDAFVIFKLGDKVRELNGSGRAGKRATIDLYEELGYSAIPTSGPFACITVPGLASAWGELLRYSGMELKELLKPAIALAEKGFPLDEKYVESIKNSSSSLGRFAGWKSIFTQQGDVPSLGFVLIQKDLASSLRTISEEGTDTFYDGRLSEKIVRGIEEEGGLIESEDLRSHTTNLVNPISVDYHGVTIYETSPNSQAPTVLLWMNMIEKFDLGGIKSDQKSVQKILIDTCLRAYGERAKWIGDPSWIQLPQGFLSKYYANNLLELPLPSARAQERSSKGGGDTTYFSVGDREGNCVSMIQSNYNGFGSGVVPRGTGIVLHNRGSYFTLSRSHHNSLFPGKRTFHTLCACLGERNGRTLFSLGTMGGDIQPQIHVQLLSKILDFKTELQEAVSGPRWFIPGTIYEPPESIFYEDSTTATETTTGLKQNCLNGLTSQSGHAQAILFEESGLLGAADPRCAGAVASY
jgi:gamma-glutamyltranspeptidase/glutathione hydrolase